MAGIEITRLYLGWSGNLQEKVKIFDFCVILRKISFLLVGNYYFHTYCIRICE